MSSTSLYEVYRTTVTCLEELRNSWGSAPPVWDYISLKCRGKNFMMYPEDKEFWPLWKSDKLTKNERAVLLSTYDNNFVETGRLMEFSVACKEVHDLILKNTDMEWSHWEAIGMEAEKLSKKHDKRCLGLGIGCTSVCDLWEQWDYKKDNIDGVYSYVKYLADGGYND